MRERYKRRENEEKKREGEREREREKEEEEGHQAKKGGEGGGSLLWVRSPPPPRFLPVYLWVHLVPVVSDDPVHEACDVVLHHRGH